MDGSAQPSIPIRSAAHWRRPAQDDILAQSLHRTERLRNEFRRAFHDKYLAVRPEDDIGQWLSSIVQSEPCLDCHDAAPDLDLHLSSLSFAQTEPGTPMRQFLAIDPSNEPWTAHGRASRMEMAIREGDEHCAHSRALASKMLAAKEKAKSARRSKHRRRSTSQRGVRPSAIDRLTQDAHSKSDSKLPTRDEEPLVKIERVTQACASLAKSPTENQVWCDSE